METSGVVQEVAEAFYKHEKDEALQLFDEVKKIHLTTANHLLTKQFAACERQLRDLFTEVEWLLHDRPVKPFDFYYDQIVCVGELLSTTIISFYLNEDGLTNQWVDVRDIIRTDSNFRDANIDWKYTEQRTEELVKPVLSSGEMVLTQGFIGATHENESTTLGREGSDFTAAVFSNLLDAESQTIWKDVASVMNADPREIKDALPLPELNYNEVIEMAYYGAQVIHPKTIKPLQNKGIPLLVKCFLNADLPGTIIHNNAIPPLPPIVMVKKNQVMITLRSKDFSFIGDHNTEELYQLLKRLFLTPTLTQNGAIKIIYAFDNREEKLKELVAEAGKSFDVQIMSGLTLLTIRHYNDEALNRFVANKDFLVRQQTAQHICLLYLEQGL